MKRNKVLIIFSILYLISLTLFNVLFWFFLVDVFKSKSDYIDLNKNIYSFLILLIFNFIFSLVFVSLAYIEYLKTNKKYLLVFSWLGICWSVMIELFLFINTISIIVFLSIYLFDKRKNEECRSKISFRNKQIIRWVISFLVILIYIVSYIFIEKEINIGLSLFLMIPFPVFISIKLVINNVIDFVKNKKCLKKQMKENTNFSI